MIVSCPLLILDAVYKDVLTLRYGWEGVFAIEEWCSVSPLGALSNQKTRTKKYWLN